MHPRNVWLVAYVVQSPSFSLHTDQVYEEVRPWVRGQLFTAGLRGWRSYKSHEYSQVAALVYFFVGIRSDKLSTAVDLIS